MPLLARSLTLLGLSLSVIGSIAAPGLASAKAHRIEARKASGGTIGVTNRRADLTQDATSVNWSQFRLTADHLANNTAETSLSPATAGGAGLAWTFVAGGDIQSSAAIVNGVGYVGSYDHKLYAFDAVTGAIKWTFTTGAAVESAPAVSGDKVIFGSDDGTIYALDASTGSVAWTKTTRAPVMSSPSIAAGVVYIGSFDGRLYALNSSDGSVVWTAPLGGIIHSSAAVSGGMVYIGSDDHKLWAFDQATGAFRWSAVTGDFVQSSPAVSGGIVYVGSHDGTMYAFNATNGQLVWSKHPQGIGSTHIQSSPAVAYGMVYVSVAEYLPVMEGYVYAFDAATGDIMWSAEMADYSIVSPAVANGLVYSSSTGFGINAYDAHTGERIMHYPALAGVESSPTVVNGMVYIGDNVGNFYALTDVTGPTMLFDQSPTDPSNLASFTFLFHSSEPTSGAFTCSLDGGPSVDCSAGSFTVNDLSDGTHTASFTGTDVRGNTATTTYTWTIDATPPVLTLDSGVPSGYTNSDTVTFKIQSNEPGSTFTCKLDAGAQTSCTSPVTYSGLADGSHTFTAWAKDAAGNVSAPVSQSWVQDRVAPTISLSGPTGLINTNQATFTMTSNESGATFKCSKDGNAYATCASPFTWNSMAQGPHTFSAYAVDLAGNAGSAATLSLTVDTVKPVVTITSGPASPTSSKTATFTFTASDASSVTFTCQLDTGTVTSCTSPKTYSGLADGTHTFYVTGTDAAGNASTKSWRWTIVSTAPAVRRFR